MNWLNWRCTIPSGTTSDTPLNILREAEFSVYGQRQQAYGHPRENFARTAKLWAGYLGAKYPYPLDAFKIDASDVAYMMVLLKMARLMETPAHRDSIVDMAGYAATAARVAGVDA